MKRRQIVHRAVDINCFVDPIEMPIEGAKKQCKQLGEAADADA
jgi:hypothetical protein